MALCIIYSGSYYYFLTVHGFICVMLVNKFGQSASVLVLLCVILFGGLNIEHHALMLLWLVISTDPDAFCLQTLDCDFSYTGIQLLLP